MKTINIKQIPDAIFWAFKVACAQARVDMRVALINFMQKFGGEEEREKEE